MNLQQRSTFMQRPTSQPVQNWTQPQQLPSQSPVRQQFTECKLSFIFIIVFIFNPINYF